MAKVFQQCKTDKDNRFYLCEKVNCGHGWTVRYREPGGRQASQREKSFPRKKEAEAFANKVEGAKLEGVYLDPERGKVPFKAWASGWIENHPVNESTARNYRGFLRLHAIPKLGHKTIAGVTSRDVLALQAEMNAAGLKPSTINDRIGGCLYACFQAAIRDKRIPENPVDGVEPLRDSGLAIDPDSIPTAAEVAAIGLHIPAQYRLTVTLMSGAGLRISEALAYGPDEDRGDFARIRRQVSSKAYRGDCITRFVPLKHRVDGEFRDVPLAPFINEATAGHAERWPAIRVDGVEAYFAPRERGKGTMPTASTYGYHWRKGLTAAGLNTHDGKPRYTPHDLRHFFASTALTNGIPILEVSRWLGHKSIKITADTYGHLTEGAADRARVILDSAMRGLFGEVR